MFGFLNTFETDETSKTSKSRDFKVRRCKVLASKGCKGIKRSLRQMWGNKGFLCTAAFNTQPPTPQLYSRGMFYISLASTLKFLSIFNIPPNITVYVCVFEGCRKSEQLCEERG